MSAMKKIKKDLAEAEEKLKAANEMYEVRRMQYEDSVNDRLQFESQYQEVKATGDPMEMEMWQQRTQWAHRDCIAAAKARDAASNAVAQWTDRRGNLLGTLNQLSNTADSKSGTPSNCSSVGVFSPATKAVVGEDSHTPAYLTRLKTFLKKRGLSIVLKESMCRIMDGVSDVVYQFPVDDEDVVRNIVVSFLLIDKGERHYTVQEWAAVLQGQEHAQVISDFAAKQTPVASPESAMHC